MSNNPADEGGGNVFDRIESLRSDFRRRWREGKRPKIEEALEHISSDARGTLFRHLLQTELRYRRRGKESPTSQEYLARFPEFASAIREEMDESTYLAPGSTREEPEESLAEPPATVEMPASAALRLGDYELIRELGRGGFGVVYEARHVARNDRVALKTLPIGRWQDDALQGADRLHSFRREFRSLAEVNHPNLVGMQSLEVADDQWFFTMDLIDGVDFLSYVRPQNRLDESRLRNALRQMVDGIINLHAQRILHRDLKPSNVLIRTDGKVSILDFGLVAELEGPTEQTTSLQTRNFAGTPRYAAPEQAFGSRSAASDWYAVGVMLFEALTGEPPFDGTFAELLIRKQSETPPQLSSRQDLPEDLAGLADALLQRDPDSRPDAEAIIEALQLDLRSHQDSVDESRFSDRSSSGGYALLVGRESQQADLEHALRALEEHGEPQVVFVRGRSGEGKTSVIERFLAPQRRTSQAIVLAGRCYDRESVPFKVLDAFIEGLVSYLRSRSPQDVASLLPADTEMLAQLFPLLRRVDSIASLDSSLAKSLDAKQLRQRAFHALKQLLAAISHSATLILFVDDLQWGDADSADVLMDILRPPGRPRILLLGGLRSDEAENSEFLRQWRLLSDHTEATSSSTDSVQGPAFHGLREIAVGPLSLEECWQLVLLRTGENAEQIQDRVHEIYEASGGNPYLIEQLIECLDPETGLLTVLPLDEVISTRLQRLPQGAESLLEVVALAGNSLSVQEAAEAAGVEASAFSVLTRMRSERLVRLIGSENQTRVDTYHDRIRETVCENLPAERRRDIHRVLGDTLERLDRLPIEAVLKSLDSPGEQSGVEIPAAARLYDLAYHYKEAEVRDKALAYSVLAAERAQMQFVPDIAMEHFRLAESLAGASSPALRYRIIAGLAGCQLQSGSYALAKQTLERAITLAPTKKESIQGRMQLAEIAYKAGSLASSVEAYQELLAEIGCKVPQSKAGLIFATALAMFTNRRYRWLPPSVRRDSDWRSELTIRLLHSLTYPSWFRDPLRALWVSLTGYNLAMRSPDLRLRCLTASGLGVTLSWLFCQKRGPQRFANEALEIARQLNDISLEAQSLHLGSGLMLDTSNADELREMLQRAVTLFRRIGDQWRVTYAQYAISLVSARQGRPATAIRTASRAFHRATKYKQHRLAQSTLDVWSIASDGRLPYAELRARFEPVSDDISSTVSLYIAEGNWHAANGRTAEALTSAERAVSTLDEIWPIRGVYRLTPARTPCRALPNLAEALRIHAAANTENTNLCKELRLRALRAARRAVRIQRRTRFDYAYALRELALILADLGRYTQAYRYAKSSCDIAKQQGADLQLAKSLRVCGQIGVELNRPEAQQLIAEGETSLASLHREIDLAHQAAAELLGFNNV